MDKYRDIRRASGHWTELVIGDHETEVVDYVQMPPKRTFSVTVRYVQRGRGEPPRID